MTSHVAGWGLGHPDQVAGRTSDYLPESPGGDQEEDQSQVRLGRLEFLKSQGQGNKFLDRPVSGEQVILDFLDLISWRARARVTSSWIVQSPGNESLLDLSS